MLPLVWVGLFFTVQSEVPKREQLHYSIHHRVCSRGNSVLTHCARPCVVVLVYRHPPLLKFLLQMVQRALSGIQEADDDVAGADPVADPSPARQGTAPSSQSSDRRKSPLELNLDGMVLRQAIWFAAVIDNEHVSLDVLIACLVVAISLCCGFAGVFCCRWVERRRCSRKSGKGGGTVRVHEMPQRILVEKRAKTA